LKSIEKQKQDENLLKDIKTVLTKLKTTSAQDDLLDIYNIWIIKPASMSRGRGIDFFNDLASILKYVIGTRVEWIV
jgi:tubulin monoglycylase TTLL3/8